MNRSYIHFIYSRKFLPLLITQFLGVFNDNLFKTALFVMISFYGLGKNTFLPPSQMLNFGALLFILPFFLFSAISGQLSTKFNKARLAFYIKLLEVIIMLMVTYGFYIQSVTLLLVGLFCMGTQSTLFGPLKYSILPDYLSKRELIMGNSLIESGTFLAILIGQILGTVIAGLNPIFIAILTLIIAITGVISSYFMPAVQPVEPLKILEFNIFKSTHQLLRQTFIQKDLYSSIFGLSWFWFIGAVYTTQLPTFTLKNLGGNENVYNLILTLFSVGIPIGSIVCAKLSHQNLRLGLIFLGALGLTVVGVLLVCFTYQNHYHSAQGILWFLLQNNSYTICFLMLLIGFFGGFFTVPLYTWLQTASSDQFRSNAIAANNIMNGVFMLFAAIISSLLILLFDSISLLFIVVAIGNIPIILYMMRLKPEIYKDFKQIINIR